MEQPGSPTAVASSLADVDGDLPDGESSLLGLQAVDQDALERNLTAQVERAVLDRDNELDEKRLKKAMAKSKELQDTITEKSSRPLRRPHELEDLLQKLQDSNEDISDIQKRIMDRKAEAERLLNTPKAPQTAQRQPNESERDFLIRTGKITPFANVAGLERTKSGVGVIVSAGAAPTTRDPRMPGFQRVEDLEDGETEMTEPKSKAEPLRKRRRLVKRESPGSEQEGDDADYMAVKSDGASSSELSELESEDDFCVGAEVAKKPKRKRAAKGKGKGKDTSTKEPVRLDDGDEKSYQARAKEWIASRSKMRRQRRREAGLPEVLPEEEGLEEWRLPCPDQPSAEFNGGFKLPGDLHPSLFPYQKVGVQWLWEIHCQGCGGIIADEMGLGKTVQTIAMIAGLHHSGMLKKPCLIVAPGAVLKQWVKEFHTWWPILRVAILHSSGSGMLVDAGNDDSDEDSDILSGPLRPTAGGKAAAKKVVDRVEKQGHILITTYEGLTTYGDLLMHREWEYAILDEGHKVRNPDAAVSLTAKQLMTPHRIILSGTPIQNNLTELWSIFDYVYPGRLGSLPIFRENFEVPIKSGGYKNATNVAVQTSTQCAMVLRELCAPYLLRRLKADVATDLPKKTEKVLFCKLTQAQRESYSTYLNSEEVQTILNNRAGGSDKASRNVLKAITTLKHICNHPDLAARPALLKESGHDYGKGIYSGKIQVTKDLLHHWKQHGHRTLLFSQGTQILDILEKNIRGYEGFEYRRMDGGTPIANRQQIVNEFNNDDNIDVFLLTTKVGGLGLNLIGADRVIIFDPDWNPSTDMQARERAWRIGQKKDVAIFRLVTAGTIEEKQYQRQVFKQHLANKILNDPQQSKRFFQSDSLHDLFTLGSSMAGTETGSMFSGAEKLITPAEPATQNRSDEEPYTLTKLPGVAGLSEYTVKDDEGGPSNGTGIRREGERQFIEMVFASSGGVLSSVEHEAVIGAAQHKDKMSASEAYAVQVADQARKAIRDFQPESIGTLTWTGKNGIAGLPKPPAPKRKSPPADSDPGGERMLRKLKIWLRRNGGKATTAELQELGRQWRISQIKRPNFKKALTTLTNKDKEHHLFTLKAEYNNA